MKKLTLSVIALVVLAACGGGSDDDSDVAGNVDPDNSCELDTEINEETECPVRIRRVVAGCDTSSCTWTIEADGQLSLGDLFIIQTADPEFDASCDQILPTTNEIFCGTWGEYHGEFELVSTANSFGGDTLSKVLLVTESYEGALEPGYTYFSNDPQIIPSATALVEVYDANGELTDCATAGHFVEHFSGRCSVVVDNFFPLP